MKKLLSYLLLLSVGCSAVAAPNVLFIAVDDLKPELGCYGSSKIKSPNLDRLAGEGTVFLKNYCQQAVCGPTRASLLTGFRPDVTKVWDLATQIRTALPDVKTLPQLFRENGYYTAGVGKIFDPRTVDKQLDELSWSEPYPNEWELKFNEQAGHPFGHYQTPEIKAFKDEAPPTAQWNKFQDFMLEKEAWPAVEAADVPDDAYDDGAICNKAIEFLEKAAASGKPFFVAAGFKKPHLPFVAPKKYWDLYNPEELELAGFQQLPEGAPAYAGHESHELRKYTGIPESGPLDEATQRRLMHGYYACISYTDAQIGKLLAKLDELGLRENTIVVLWGDHGWHLGDHGIWCKHTNFEQATRSPLIISMPGVAGGVRVEAITEFLDVYPTLVEGAGLTPPAGLEGKSLLPLMKGEAASIKEVAVSQYPRGNKMGYSLRSGRFRYTAWLPFKDQQPPATVTGVEAEELYDYEKDPAETRSIVADPAYAKVRKKFVELLNNYLSSGAN